MRIIWFTPTSSLYSKVNHHYYGGGWIESLEECFKGQNSIELAISFFHTTNDSEEVIDNIRYFPIKKSSIKKNPFKTIINNYLGKIEDENIYIPKILKILNDFKPDIIHIFGTEGMFPGIQQITDIPVIIHIQGILNPILNSFYPPLTTPLSFLLNRNYFFLNITGFSPAFTIKKIRKQSLREEQHFKKAQYLMGRTHWDKNISRILSPNAKYFHVNEILRPIFYESQKKDYQFENTIKLISTISSTTYKGLDVILKTARLLNILNISFNWQIIGIDNNDKLLKFYENRFKIFHKKYNIECLGKCSSEKLVYFLINSDFFIHASYIDNSPNSVCEAQMIGLPVIASNVGGVSSIITDGKTGTLIPSNGIYEIAVVLNDYLLNPEKYFTIGRNARMKALQRHDRKNIIENILNIYNQIKK